MKDELREIIDSFPEENRFTEIQYMEFMLLRRKFLNIAEQVFKNVPPQGRILIFECNRSYLPMVIHKFGFHVDYQVLRDVYSDTNGNGDSLLLEALQNDHEVSLCNSPEMKYDAILMVNIVERLAMNPSSLLRKINDILKPGGCILLVSDNVARLGARVRLVLGKNVYPSYKDFYDSTESSGRVTIIRQYNLQELRELTLSAGFTLIDSGFAINHPALNPWQGITMTRYMGKHICHLLKKLIPPLRDSIFLVAGKT